MHANKQYVDTTPLIVMVRIYKFRIVRSILYADADINLKVIKGHRVMSPAEATLRIGMWCTGQDGITELLVARGSTLLRTSAWKGTGSIAVLK
jgi:hypothetical protein